MAKYACPFCNHSLTIHASCNSSSLKNNGIFIKQKRNDQFSCNSWRRCSIKLQRSKADLADTKLLNIKISSSSRLKANYIKEVPGSMPGLSTKFVGNWISTRLTRSIKSLDWKLLSVLNQAPAWPLRYNGSPSSRFTPLHPFKCAARL